MNRRGKDGADAKTLPHHDEAEASVLGGIILRNDALALLDNLEVEAFYNNRHKVVFAAMRELEAKLIPIDVVTLESEIGKAGKLEAIGGIGFLGELTLRCPTVDNIEDYAKIVTQHRLTREVMLMLSSMLDEAYHGESEGEQLVHDVTTALMSIRTGGDRPIHTVAELVAVEAGRIVADIEARRDGIVTYSGIPTGISAIDDNIGGHPVGIATVYVARPGNGKTTIASHVAKGAREIAGEESLIASYEDSRESFGLRGLAQESGLSTQLLRARRIKLDDLVEVTAGWAAAASRTEMVLQAHGMSAEALVRRLRRENLKRLHQGKKKIRQLLVDYVQKMPQPDRVRSREEGITHNSGVLCAAAEEERVALVMFAQLNREVERRDDHEPRLSDIRESGSIEQDGKLIIAIYRPWNYKPKDFPEEELHLIGLKNHNGENHFDIKLHWDVKSNAVYNNPVEYQMARARRTASVTQHQRGTR